MSQLGILVCPVSSASFLFLDELGPQSSFASLNPGRLARVQVVSGLPEAVAEELTLPLGEGVNRIHMQVTCHPLTKSLRPATGRTRFRYTTNASMGLPRIQMIQF